MLKVLTLLLLRLLSSKAQKGKKYENHLDDVMLVLMIHHINIIYDITFNLFWSNVLSSLFVLWENDNIVIPDDILVTPLWYNDNLQIPMKKEWVKKRYIHNRGCGRSYKTPVESGGF